MSSVTSFGVLNAGDFLESSKLLKARITISKFLNFVGLWSTFKCVGSIDSRSEGTLEVGSEAVIEQ